MGCCTTKNKKQQKDIDYFMNILDKNITDETKIQERNKLFQIPKNPIFQRRLSQKKENSLTKQTYSYLERNNQTSKNCEYI
ncbi:unnamed protein product [Paramecium primaurelia]|uniref:Uncharacterized protein n=2 Tax=Paramecium TaxID=5884 RepID=A0A8S1VSJ6_9CILI|nr:unnamed protein product [Paramecium primaurelia]CAD8178732.1 unnamed protein product [Paramecium pentaurelia]